MYVCLCVCTLLLATQTLCMEKMRGSSMLYSPSSDSSFSVRNESMTARSLLVAISALTPVPRGKGCGDETD